MSKEPYINYEQEILKLKKKLGAVILAHYYQDSEIQDLADFVGDSLDLSRKAAATDAKLIVFCGVRFMAEAAYILNPGKKVIIPDLAAGCSLEESCPADKFKAFCAQHPDHIIITYINSSAEVKALSDIIVTSTNAEKIIKSIPQDQPIIFAPDRHLGKFLSKKTGRDMVLWQGSCIVHENFSERELVKIKAAYPQARIIAHPECADSLLNHAEHIGSTSSLISYVRAHNPSEFIILTEPGIIHQMKKVASDSKFYDVPALESSGCTSCATCPFMRLNTIEKLYDAMKNLSPEVTVEEEIALRARKSLEKMLVLS